MVLSYNSVAKNLLLPLADSIGNTSIHSKLKFLEKSQFWTTKELENYQLSRLKHLVKSAYNEVPYYNSLFKMNNLLPEDINKISDLSKIPILTKNEIRKNISDFKSKSFKTKKLRKVSTGGSTGVPLDYMMSWETYSWHRAALYRNYNRALGNCIGVKTITLGGSSLVPNEKTSLKKRLRNTLIDRTLLISSYNMDEAQKSNYLKIINDYKPEVLRGYPNSIFELAKFTIDRNISTPSIKAILTTAEKLHKEYRKEIELAFDQNVFPYKKFEILFKAQWKFR